MNAAHLHLVFNHLPAGCLACALVLSAIAWCRDNRGFLQGALLCLGLASVLTVAAWLTGGPAAEYILEMGGSSGRSVLKHREYATYALAGALVFGLAALGIAVWLRRNPGRNVRIPAAAVFSMACIWSAWLAVVFTVGGMIRHWEVMNCTWY